LASGFAALPAHASSSVFERNLITNGDAEAGSASADGTPVAVPGWNIRGTNFAVVDYDGDSGTGFAFPPSAGGPPDHGANVFTGGIHDGNTGSAACGVNSAAVSCATQSANVSQGASLIDAGDVTFSLSGWLGGFGDQADSAVLTATFRNVEGDTLATAQIGPVTAAERGSSTILLPRSSTGSVPAGTRDIDLRLDMTWVATGYNDGYADSLSLVLHTSPASPAAWGRNGDGQVGDGTTNHRSAPVSVSGLTDVIAMAGGYFHTLALKSDGTVWAWGQDDSGQLGNGAGTSSSTTPVQVMLPGEVPTPLSGIVAVAAAGFQSMALQSDGTIYQWGSMPGLNGGAVTGIPTALSLVDGVGATAIAAGVNHSLALADNGKVLAWGDNAYGQLGNGTNTAAPSTSPVTALDGVVSISAGQFHSVALTRSATIKAWGLNNHGQLGDGSTTNRNAPVTADLVVVSIPEFPPTVTAIDAGENHTLALLSNGTVYYTGSDGADPEVHVFVQKAGITTAIGISGGEAASFVLLTDRTVQAWGDNACGQLGIGLVGGPCSGTFTPSPVITQTQVSGLSGVSVVEAGHLTNYALIGTTVPSGIANLALTLAEGDSTTGPGVTEAALADIPLTDIPEDVGAGPGDAPVGKSPVGKSPVGKSPVGKSPVGKSPVGKSPVGKSPVGKSPVGKSPVGKSPVGKSPVGKSPLSAFILLRPGGWPEVLAHTSDLVGATPQSVTWDQLLNDPYALDADPCTLPELRSSSAPLTCGGTLQPPPLTLDQIVWSTSPIANLSFLSLLMGDVIWNDVANTAPGGWCAEWAETGHPCASTADLGQTIFESEANGLPSYLTSLPTKHVGDIADPSKTLFWDVTLIDLNVNGSFLGNALIADIGASLATATEREAARDQVVNCTRVDCSDSSTDTLGDAYDDQTTPDDLSTSALRDTGTFADLGTDVLGTRSLTSIEIAFLDPRAISWEDVPLSAIPWQTFPEDSPTHFIQYLLDFDVDCRDSSGLQATVHLPNDFRYRPGSSRITAGIQPEADIGNPTTDSETGDLTWDLSEFECSGILPQHFSLRFAAMPGFNRGTFTSDASVHSATAQASVDDTAPVTVASGFTGNGSPATGAAVSTNSLLVVHPSTDPQYFTFSADPGDEVQVSLSHQGHDGDIVLYAPAGSSGEPLLSANAPQTIPFGKNPLDDPALNEATDALPPESLQDVTIVPELPVAAISNFRGTEVDAVTTTVPDGGGPVTYTLQLDWFNDDVGPEPAVATIRSFDPVDLPPCQERSTFLPGGPGVTATSTPAIGAGVNTLLLFDQKRTGDMFGAAAATAIKSSLLALVGSTGIPGVSAEIVYLDSFGSVNAAFTTADADPCSPANNNNVVKAINDAVASLGPLSNIRNVVIVGDEYLIPHARLLDETAEGNEREFTGDTFFGSNTNELGGAFAAGYFLSDAPYGTRTPVSLLGKTVYLPQWAVGRLGGSDQTIRNAIDSFIAANGLADPRTTTTEPRTALVTDYDGFSDGGLLAFNELQSQVGTGNAVRLSGAWTRGQYANELFNQVSPGVYDPKDVVVQNGHHDQYRMLPGAFDGTSFTPSDLFTTEDIGTGPSMQKRVVLSIGCHFALDFPAELAPGATGTDADRLNYWAKAYFDQGASVLVGNLGYGYFDTSTTAFDESLMDDFVSNLDEFPTAGEALRQAEVEYFTTMASFTPYDRKVLQQTIMWGFPMTRMPGAPAPAPVEASPATASSTSSLSTDPISGLESTTITVAPTLIKTTLGDGTQFYRADDGTQATHPYPILPLVSKPLPSGSIAKGAVPVSITYSDDTSYTAAFANATVDSSAIESAPPFEVGGYPSTLASIGTAVGPDGSFLQRLNVTPGLFRPTDVTTDSPAVGLFRKFTNTTWLVTYGAPDGSTEGPTISETEAIEFGGNTAFVVDVDHPSRIARVFVQAFRSTGAVDRVELSNGGTGTRWTGGATGTDIFEYWVFAISNAGTSASSTNKAVGYVPQPPPTPPSGSVTLTTDPPSPGEDGWFEGDVDVSVTPDEERISIDGDEAQAGPRTVTGNGVHVVDAVGPDETIDGSILVPIDAAAPTITIDTPPSGVPEYLLNEVVAEGYECFDEGSGVASCTDDNPGTNLDTSTVGPHTFTVTATDFAGHTTSLTRTYHVLYKFSGFFSPVDNPPTTNVVKAGSSVPIKWRITDVNGVGVSDPSSFVSVTSALSGGACGASTDAIETLATTSGLQYLGDGIWQFNWRTQAGYKGQCRTMNLNLKDGTGTPTPSRTYQSANFLFK
jgi:alpha-tubulin suppressor-like RCC1 family protein